MKGAAALGLCGLSLCVAVRAQTPPPAALYTRAQADRGVELYKKACASCHTLGALSSATKGPSLSDTAFLAKWTGKSAYELIYGIQSTMPNDFSMELTMAQAADVTAAILQANGFKDGDAELPSSDEAKKLTIAK